MQEANETEKKSIEPPLSSSKTDQQNIPKFEVSNLNTAATDSAKPARQSYRGRGGPHRPRGRGGYSNFNNPHHHHYPHRKSHHNKNDVVQGKEAAEVVDAGTKEGKPEIKSTQKTNNENQTKTSLPLNVVKENKQKEEKPTAQIDNHEKGAVAVQTQNTVIAELHLELEVGKFLFPVYKFSSPLIQAYMFIQQNQLNHLLPVDIVEKYQIALALYVQDIQQGREVK